MLTYDEWAKLLRDHKMIATVTKGKYAGRSGIILKMDRGTSGELLFTVSIGERALIKQGEFYARREQR